MTQHFATVGENINRSQEFVRHKNMIESTPMRIAQDDSEPYNGPITLAELKGCLKTTKETSPGKDEITYSMLKNAHELFIRLLLKLYNKIYTEHVFPTKWLIAVVIPIHKQDKDPKKATS